MLPEELIANRPSLSESNGGSNTKSFSPEFDRVRMSINHTKNPNAKRPSHELLETEEDD